ncbi:glycosyltransferase family 87 protein [Flavobacterium pallidum]|uniref:DUF2029 domain-containing protein n=1 Tax=Flavobacterium pallidum TaxID=2172098 RepID=A0A2S1SG71_9FLAO|nr:glycosyltransferase family 87 protein [Flavobacterium pallidum]AWI25361.1 hypothetical protein HYN49_05300 [Flavobacterium pallidum]
MKSLFKYYYWFPLLLLCGFYVFRAVDFPVHDFANYYFGGRFLIDGSFGKWVYFPYEFNKVIFDLGHKGVFVSYAPNTPFLALLFAPLSLIPVAAAKIIFNIVSCGLFFFSLKRLVDFNRINLWYMAIIPLLFFVPIKNDLLFGQVYMLLFFLLAESWLAYQKNRLKSMAMWLSLAIMLKVFPVFLVLILLFKKQFRAFICVFVGMAILFAVSLPFTGIGIWIFYLNAVLPKASNGEIATAFVDNYQSVFMFLKRLLVYDYPENTSPWWGNHQLLFSGLVAAFKIMLIAGGYYISKKATDPLLAFSYWIFALLLMSPYGSTYSLLLLAFPVLLVLKNDWPNSKKAVCFFLFLLINNIPLALFMQQPFPVSYLRLVLLLLLATMLILSVSKLLKWKIISAVSLAALLAVLLLQQTGSRPDGFHLTHQEPILIYDYRITANKLTYHFWNENGPQSRSESLKFSTVQPLEIRNGEVFYNHKMLTSDQSNKMKPILLDHHTVIYLSDFDRGIGFYALKKIDL